MLASSVLDGVLERGDGAWERGLSNLRTVIRVLYTRVYLCVGRASSLPTECGEVDKAWNGGHSINDVMEDNPDAPTFAANSM